MSPPYGWMVGRKWFAKCMECGGIIRVDKPVLGSLHICVEDPVVSEILSRPRSPRDDRTPK